MFSTLSYLVTQWTPLDFWTMIFFMDNINAKNKDTKQFNPFLTINPIKSIPIRVATLILNLKGIKTLYAYHQLH